MCSKYWIQHKRTIYVSYAYDSNGFSVKILSLCHFILLNAFQLSKNLLKRSWWQMDSVELFIFINLNSDINTIIIIRTANFKQWINFFLQRNLFEEVENLFRFMDATDCMNGDIDLYRYMTLKWWGKLLWSTYCVPNILNNIGVAVLNQNKLLEVSV